MSLRGCQAACQSQEWQQAATQRCLVHHAPLCLGQTLATVTPSDWPQLPNQVQLSEDSTHSSADLRADPGMRASVGPLVGFKPTQGPCRSSCCRKCRVCTAGGLSSWERRSRWLSGWLSGQRRHTLKCGAARTVAFRTPCEQQHAVPPCLALCTIQQLDTPETVCKWLSMIRIRRRRGGVGPPNTMKTTRGTALGLPFPASWWCCLLVTICLHLLLR